MATDDLANNGKPRRETADAAVATGLADTINLHGEASAEFVKSYRGVDRHTGEVFARGHKKISQYKINERYRSSNLKQQAGFSAEEAASARYNARQILDGKPERMVRTEDAGFGANDPVNDHVKTVSGRAIPGSGSQMKFVDNVDVLLQKIAKGHGGGANDLSRYLNNPLDLPSDQVAYAKALCDDQSALLHEQANNLEQKGETELAQRKRDQAENYQTVKKNIQDSGVSREEALEYRERPKIATAKDIGRVSHRAGLKGAQLGAALGGGVAVVTNFILVASGEKTLDAACKDCAAATLKAAVTGYATAFTGAAIAGLMRQAASEGMRRLASTNLPGMAITVCVSLAESTKRLVTGAISFDQFVEDIGESGSSLLAAGALAAAGQMLIPIPVVGAVIGGMVGYSLSSMFYRSAAHALREARESETQYLALKQFCEESRRQLDAEKRRVETVLRAQIDLRKANVQTLFDGLEQALESGNVDAFCQRLNQFASGLGHEVAYASKEEFDSAMLSGRPISI
ncbi:hypothetical protein [Salinisphaera sp. S4-8]|uniref:hypothetical protein n=1 Tax=Salinisphaera sp. S4-8 TaxID=633357 RepID=UPI0033409FAC